MYREVVVQGGVPGVMVVVGEWVMGAGYQGAVKGVWDQGRTRKNQGRTIGRTGEEPRKNHREEPRVRNVPYLIIKKDRPLSMVSNNCTVLYCTVLYLNGPLRTLPLRWSFLT